MQTQQAGPADSLQQRLGALPFPADPPILLHAGALARRAFAMLLAQRAHRQADLP